MPFLLPVTSNRITIPAQTWRESCTCPGAEDERARRDRARARRYSQACKEAFNAVRVSAAGKSRARIKDLYEADLRARGLDVSPEDILDADVSLITGD